MTNARYVVGIVGGATAGAETAAMLAERGILSVVFDQNPRPYGKIEDGLPRWHVKLRQKEYTIINEKLDRPEVHFVPLTRIGRDIDFPALANEWGFTIVILAIGAWRDRPLPIEGVDEYVDRGLVYQNPFIYWFNHFCERDFRGPKYDVQDGTIVIGGGLASIDVAKVLQIESVRLALAQRGIHEDMIRLEHDGIPNALARHGLSWESLGLRGTTLYYRRRIEDMPLVEIPEGSDAERKQKGEATRRRIVEKAMQKYLFDVRPQQVPVGLLIENQRLVGLRFQQTQILDGRAVPIEGALEEVRTPTVVSSIGSIPEPISGIALRNDLYDYSDPELGRLRGYETVFSVGNVVTGKGNIVASRKHSVQIATHLIEQFLGLGGEGHDGEEVLLDRAITDAVETAEKLADWVTSRPPLSPEQVDAVLGRVRARQEEVGYRCSYQEWLQRVTPPDLG